MRRVETAVAGVERVGPYSLLLVRRRALDAGAPGQFFMLEAPGCALPRAFSLCCETRSELGFLIDPVGRGTRALAALAPGESMRVLGPLGTGFRLDVGRPLLLGGGVGAAPLPYLSACLGRPPALLGFRSAWHAEAAALVPGAEVVIDPVLVTEVIPAGHDLLACGPEAMLRAVGALDPSAQLALEAPMACGYGACYGCAVPIDGRLQRLCVAGPVIPARRAGITRPAFAHCSA